MEYKKFKLDNYNIYTIKTDKFKNCHMEAIFRKVVVKDDLTKDAMLCDILMRSSKKYPTRSDIGMIFEELYNTSIYGVTSKVGSTLFTNYCLDFLHPKYTEKNIPNKAIKLLFEMLKYPNVKNNAFNIDNFNIVKNNLKADILAQKENVVGYAIRRMLEHLDNKSPSSYSVSGYLDDLDLITPENLFDHYKKTMENSLCDIYIIGDFDMKSIVNIIDKNFKPSSKPSKKIKLFTDNKVSSNIQCITENDEYKQSNLIIGCNVIDLTEKEKNIILPLYNVILGAGSLETKLAKYLRTDNSLCYQTNSVYQKYDKLLIIYAGIDKSSYELAVKLIKKAIKEMQDGNISKEELENAKLLITSSLEMTFDNAAGLINNYVFEVVNNLPKIEDRIKEVNKVTKEEIIAVAKKIKLNTIYHLAPGGEKK